jgi:succinate dehydrogenase/fumarate reductase flavoprotein subunit
VRAVPAWDDEADVIVVGFGVAGAAAAIEARAAGSDVLVLKRAGGPGGTSAIAGGHFYLGGGTPVQEACGFHDTADAMYGYLVACTKEPDRAKIRAYCDGSVDLFHWLEAHGVPFDRSYYADKHVIQPGRDCLIWSGNENVWPFRDLAPPAPRGHKVATEGDGGPLIVRALSDAAEAAGTRIAYDTAVTGLVAADDGRVVGVRTRSFSQTRHVHGRRGVVLAAGGFVMNRALVERYAPALADPVTPVGCPYDDGAGIELGRAAGGALEHMDGAFVSVTNYPPSLLLKGVLVNAEGNRFVAEDSYHARTTAACAAQPGGVAYLIVDDATFAYPEFQSMPFVDGWETVAEAEIALALPDSSLRATLDAYNTGARMGEDPEFHKQSEWLQPLDHPPYAAFDASRGRAVYVGFTVGGLRTSIDGEVLTTSGAPVPGLFAAGACASNIVQDSLGYCSGICLGEAAFFGRRAGAVATQRVPD